MALEKIAGLWANTKKRGSHLASGQIELASPATFVISTKDGPKNVTVPAGRHGILVLKNDYKKEEKHPSSLLKLVIPEELPDEPAGGDDDIPF